MPLATLWEFQSPPSVRKATLFGVGGFREQAISIPAFREDGDKDSLAMILYILISIPAFREEGDPAPRHLQDLLL